MKTILPLSLIIAVGTAIIVQDFTEVIPLGIFNQHREQYFDLVYACLIGTIIVGGVLIGEAWRGRRSRVAGMVRMGLVWFIVIEFFLFGVDRVIVSQNPQSRVGGPYYEKTTKEGNWVILRKSSAEFPFGFRTDHPYQHMPSRPRVLFLGDSYTEGSGQASACNYPQVVEGVLREQLGNVEIMNAGVAGYGPVEALTLLSLLREDGYRFDALVYNVFAENDFTDNLPGTERRVVGGIISRFPRSRFLKVFHPLNSYLFRYGLVFWRLGTLSPEESPRGSLRPGGCNFQEETLTQVSPELRELIKERLEGTLRVVQSPPAQQEFHRVMTAMDAEAKKMEIPFIVVLFPDRIMVDKELQERLAVGEKQFAPFQTLYAFVHQAVPDVPVIEVTTELQGRSGMFRADDTHLSDLGNKIAGSYVGKKLVDLLMSLQTGDNSK